MELSSLTKFSSVAAPHATLEFFACPLCANFRALWWKFHGDISNGLWVNVLSNAKTDDNISKKTVPLSLRYCYAGGKYPTTLSLMRQQEC